MEVKYILDPKDFSGHPAANLFVKSIDTILQDPEVRVVVETIGGTRFAYPYVKACLESGRSVCTSNTVSYTHLREGMRTGRCVSPVKRADPNHPSGRTRRA